MSGSVKRFWREVGVEQVESGGFTVALDQRPIRLPGGNRLVVPSRVLAEAIADEWRAIPPGESFNAQALSLTRIAGTMIERVALHRTQVIDTLLGYGAADLLCYRSDERSIAQEQTALFDPILEVFFLRYGVKPQVTDGILPIPLDPRLEHELRADLEHFPDAALAALGVIVPVLSSLFLGMSLVNGSIDEKQALEAAFIDERAQMRRWGEDVELLDQLAVKARDVNDACRFLFLARESEANEA
ncbi:ATP12 family protein [Kozakia baliensis]|uniref:ATP12 family chaperone protein n=1 Tax=Kozakia baliensis TaxID=153496 RepID=UPI00345C3BF4